jgi:hypothetical protein
MGKISRIEAGFEYLDAFIGISFQLHDYRLVYEINKALGLALEKTDDLQVVYFQKDAEEESISEHSCFSVSDPDKLLTYFLLSNTGSEGFRLIQQKEADFFLLVKGAGDDEIEKNLLQQVRKIPRVVMAFSIDQKKVANVESLISDLELHDTNLRKSSKVKDPEIESQDDLF